MFKVDRYQPIKISGELRAYGSGLHQTFVSRGIFGDTTTSAFRRTSGRVAADTSLERIVDPSEILQRKDLHLWIEERRKPS